MSVTYANGFQASGVWAGIKEKGEDIALIFSDQPASAAGTFTTNLMRAAPVLLDMSRVPRATARVVVVNSGNANACTGDQGSKDAREMAFVTAKALGVPEDDVLVASTGIIGKVLPMDKIKYGISEAVRSLDPHGGAAAARAIMTTDTRPKEASAGISIGGSEVRIGGMAKGAGMICPNMATMLCFITTDAAIAPEVLQKALLESVDLSFNCLTVDGDSSTNDSVIIMANGMAGNQPIEPEGPNFDTFKNALDEVTVSLAKQIARDGEGATKLIEIQVNGASSFQDAGRIAKTVANSALVKTAMFGCDPNWGRILAASGRAGVDFDPASVSLSIDDTPLVRNGEPVQFNQQAVHDILCRPEVKVLLEVGTSSGTATVWTCDFSYDYVKINAEYHT